MINFNLTKPQLKPEIIGKAIKEIVPLSKISMAIEQTFPKARLVLLIESGTHLIVDALISPYKMGERRRAIQLLRSVGPRMLLMWDRGLHSYRMVYESLKRKAHILGRVPANVKGVSPLRISFTGSLKVIRRAVAVCQSNKEPELDPHYYSWILAEIGENILPPRQNRSNPRVVKKPRSKFNSYKPKYRGKGTILKIPDYQICYPKIA